MNEGARQENAARDRDLQRFDARTSEMLQRDVLSKLQRIIELLEKIEASTRPPMEVRF